MVAPGSGVISVSLSPTSVKASGIDTCVPRYMIDVSSKKCLENSFGLKTKETRGSEEEERKGIYGRIVYLSVWFDK